MAIPPVGRSPDPPRGGPEADDGAFTEAARSANDPRTAARQRELLLDLGQMALDIAGLIDPTPISDGLNAVISIGRGDVLGAVTSGVSMVPYAGDLAKAGKLGRYAETMANAVDLARTNAAFAQAARPVLDKLRGVLDGVPIDKLPAPLREPLQKLKNGVDDFFASRPDAAAPATPPGAAKPTGPDGAEAPKPAASAEAARCGRTDEQFETLAKDPAHNDKTSAKSIQERTVGLELEARGDVPGPITRDPIGAADFIDAGGTKWDVKGFNSHFKPSKGGFDVQVDAGKVDKSLAKGENVMLDTSKMAPNDIAALKAEGATRGWGDKVVYWP